MKIIWIVALAAMAVLALAGCKVTVSEEDEKPEPIAVESITLDITERALTPDETWELKATVKPDNADNKTVTWSSSDENIAKVDNDGNVTAVKVGTATITAEAGGKSATCTVTVKDKLVEVTGVKLNKDTLTLTRTKTEKLTATVTPSDADNKTVTWSSSDENIATVDENGTVTAVKVGTAKITAQAGGKTVTCAVTVNPIPVDSVTLDPKTLTLNEDKTKKLTATVKPDNADGKTVTWSSDNTNVATVDEKGTVTAVKEGEANITAKAGDKTATCTVTVSKKYNIDENGVITKYNGKNETEVVIPEGVTGIGNRAFSGCSDLTEVTIPASVTSIGEMAFSGCMSLKTVTYGGTLEQWCAMNNDSNLVSFATSVVLAGEDSLDLKKQTELTIPAGVTSIGKYAFCDCKGLKSVTIPNSVTSIGDNAFFWCTSLTSVTIPASVTSIGSAAFDKCSKLDTVTYGGTEDQWNAITNIKNSSLKGKTITGKDENGTETTWTCE